MGTEQRRVVRVFLASPSDLAPERRLAKEVSDKFNDQWADCFNLQIELVGWEDTVSVYGRPQDTINQDLARCELFVGMLWQEWGTANERYSSGFEEEFRLSEIGLQTLGRPEISLLFKEVDESRLRDPGELLKKVLLFKSEMQGKILFKTFNDEPQFRSRFEGILADHVKRLLKREREQQAKETQSQSTAIDNSSENPLPSGRATPQLPAEGLSFLRRFASKAEHDEQTKPITTGEIARLRLLSTLISRTGNDEGILGVHDANVLFRERDNSSLTELECAGLVDAALIRFGAENVPYWHWLNKVGGLEGQFLPFRSLFGSNERRAGALRLMRLLRLPLYVHPAGPDRTYYLDSWLHASEHRVVKEAALAYLAICGIQNDLPLVKTEIERSDYHTVKAAIHSYTSILLKVSASNALSALIELQPESIEPALLDQVFTRAETLSEELLTLGLSHRSPDLRKRAATELRRRGRLSTQQANQLSNDPDPEVRLQGLVARMAEGELINDTVARDVLIKRKTNQPFSLLQLGAATEGEPEFQQFLVAVRKMTPLADLRRLSTTATIFDGLLKIEELRRTFKRRGNELRAAISDQFKEWFKREFANIEAQIGNPETRHKIAGLEDSFRKEWMREAVDIIGGAMMPADLNLIRKALTNGYVSCNMNDIAYLTKYGEWEDISIILSYVKTGTDQSPLFLGGGLSQADTLMVAKALCRLAGKRLHELLSIEMRSSLRAVVVAAAGNVVFKLLADSEIIAFLRDSSDVFRRTVALKCVVSLPKSRVMKIFRSYMSSNSDRYYNVVAWLDLGISVDRHIASDVARRAIADRN